MAVATQALKTDNASTKTDSTTKNNAREQPVRRRNGGTAASKDGAERLRQAADKRVGRNSEKLADLLTEKALDGNLASAKVLLALTGAKKPIQEPVKKRRGPSLAELLAAEPEWKGEGEGGD